MSELFGNLHVSQFALFAIVAVSIGVLVYFHMRRGNPFSIYDLLLDPITKKASLDSCVTLFFAVLSAWFVVFKAQHPDAGNVGGELVQILSVFLIYRGAHQGIQAYAAKPPPPPPVPDQVRQQVVVTPDAPTIAADKLPSAVTTRVGK